MPTNVPLVLSAQKTRPEGRQPHLLTALPTPHSENTAGRVIASGQRSGGPGIVAQAWERICSYRTLRPYPQNHKYVHMFTLLLKEGMLAASL